MLSFKGQVSSDLTQSILSIVSSRLDKIEDNLRLRKKVFNVLVETLQNLCRYIEEVDNQADITGNKSSAILYIWMDKEGYHIATGNYIHKTKVPKLESWLNTINSHSKESLRALYKEVLDKTEISEKGGAGLGFIDIARKSGQKLSFTFNDANETYAFFCFQININLK